MEKLIQYLGLSWKAEQFGFWIVKIELYLAKLGIEVVSGAAPGAHKLVCSLRQIDIWQGYQAVTT